MRIAELMLVGAGSSLGISFPWWMWGLAVFDILLRIADDHREWQRARQGRMAVDGPAAGSGGHGGKQE